MTAKPDAGGIAADIYLTVKTKRAGVLKGEAKADGYETPVALDGFHFGLHASSAIGSGQATGRRQYDTLAVVKRLDSATTPLLAALATNDEVSEAKLVLRKPGDGQDDFFTITLNRARVTSVNIDCDADGHAIERVDIAFSKIEVAYRVQNALGIAGATSVFADEFELG